MKNFTNPSQNENHLLNISMNSVLEKYFRLTHCQTLFHTKHPFLTYNHGNTAACNTYTQSRLFEKKLPTVTCYHHYHPQGHAHLWFGCHIPLRNTCTGGARQSNFKATTSGSTAVWFTSTFGELDNSPWCRWIKTSDQGRIYVGAGRALALSQIHLLPPPPPQIQKLADHSDVISEVPKCSKIQKISLGLGAYSALSGPLTDGEGARWTKNPTPLSALRVSFLQVSMSNPLQSWQPY